MKINILKAILPLILATTVTGLAGDHEDHDHDENDTGYVNVVVLKTQDHQHISINQVELYSYQPDEIEIIEEIEQQMYEESGGQNVTVGHDEDDTRPILYHLQHNSESTDFGGITEAEFEHTFVPVDEIYQWDWQALFGTVFTEEFIRGIFGALTDSGFWKTTKSKSAKSAKSATTEIKDAHWNIEYENRPFDALSFSYTLNEQEWGAWGGFKLKFSIQLDASLKGTETKYIVDAKKEPDHKNKSTVVKNTSASAGIAAKLGATSNSFEEKGEIKGPLGRDICGYKVTAKNSFYFELTPTISAAMSCYYYEKNAVAAGTCNSVLNFGLKDISVGYQAELGLEVDAFGKKFIDINIGCEIAVSGTLGVDLGVEAEDYDHILLATNTAKPQTQDLVIGNVYAGLTFKGNLSFKVGGLKVKPGFSHTLKRTIAVDKRISVNGRDHLDKYM